jgi:hypothetical protein
MMTGKRGAVKQTVMKKSVLTAFCNALRKDTAKLQPMNGESEWGDYYAHTNYTDTARHMQGDDCPGHAWGNRTSEECLGPRRE